MALRRVFDNAVFYAILVVARGQCGGLDCRQLTRWYETGRLDRQGLGMPDGRAEQVCPIVSRSAGDDTVVVGGIALGLHQRLTSTVRTGTEVRPLGRLSIEC